MMKFKIEDKTYRLPEYLTIENYVKIFKMKDLFDDELFSAKLLNQLTGVAVDDILAADYQDVNYLASYVLGLLPKEKPQFADRFELDGVQYGFFPKWEGLTFAEWVDLDTISTKPENELLDLLHILAAIMYRPIVSEKSKHDFQIEKYDLETMTQRAELFKKKLDVTFILGAQFFFINFATRFSNLTQLSLIKTIPIWTRLKLMWKLRKVITNQVFKRHTAGTLSQTELLEITLKTLNIYSEKD